MASKRAGSVVLGVAVLLSAGFGAAQAQPLYDIKHIPPAPGDLGSIAYGINAMGRVVGWSVGTGVEHAYFWESEVTVALPAFGDDGLISTAWAINNRGQVVGESSSNGFWTLAALWTRDDDGLWQVENLGTLPNFVFSRALDINAAGDKIAGFIDDGIVSHAAIWEHRDDIDPPWVITDLGLLPGDEAASATGINSSGKVVGYSGRFDRTVALVWEKDDDGMWVMTQVPGLLGVGNAEVANGINEVDQIVGSAAALDGFSHAVIWEYDTSHEPSRWKIIDLGAYPGEWTYGLAINDGGQVVGETWALGVGVARAILADDGRIYDLNDLIPPGTPWDLKSAFSINNAGQIVGRGDIAGIIHSFLLTPR